MIINNQLFIVLFHLSFASFPLGLAACISKSYQHAKGMSPIDTHRVSFVATRKDKDFSDILSYFHHFL